ncbi:tgtA5 cluster protein 2 [Cronobacter dublinensis]
MVIHLITTCSSKAATPGSRVFSYHNTDLSIAMATSRALLNSERSAAKLTTAELYRGTHWKRALMAMTYWPETQLWVISAGLGLRHASDTALPYDATFHAKTHAPEAEWKSLTTQPLLPGRCTSIAELMCRYPGDCFVIAGSPVYISADEKDIVMDLNALDSAQVQLTVVTSQKYSGALLPYVAASNAGMLSRLNANMTTHNISHALNIINNTVGTRNQLQN